MVIFLFKSYTGFSAFLSEVELELFLAHYSDMTRLVILFLQYLHYMSDIINTISVATHSSRVDLFKRLHS